MDKSFVKKKIINYYIENFLIILGVFLIIDYFFETQKIIGLLGTLIVNLIFIYTNPSQFLVDFEINDGKISFNFINSHFKECKLEIPINDLKCYKLENSGFINTEYKIIFFQSFEIDKFTFFDEGLMFRLEKFCKTYNIYLKTKFLQ